jgi:hypothetical protein
MNDSETRDPFAPLRQRASERADRTVERIRASVALLQATGRKITAESLKQITRELEPGFAGLSFQVIRSVNGQQDLNRGGGHESNFHGHQRSALWPPAFRIS